MMSFMLIISNTPCLFEAEQVLAIEELLPNKLRQRWRIGRKLVYPNRIDEEDSAVFSKYIDSKLPKKVISKLHSWVKTLNHVMWGGKDYDTLDSLTRVLNPEEVFSHYTVHLVHYIYI